MLASILVAAPLRIGHSIRRVIEAQGHESSACEPCSLLITRVHRTAQTAAFEIKQSLDSYGKIIAV